MSTKLSSKMTAEAQGIQLGVYKAFTDWLEWHSATSPEAVQLGVQAAVGEWLDRNEYSIEQMIKEEMGNVIRETMPAAPAQP